MCHISGELWRRWVSVQKPFLYLTLLLLAAVLLLPLAGCGKKDKLLPRDDVADPDSGIPVELRIYPPRQSPAAAIGVDDAMRAIPGDIVGRDLTPTPEEQVSPEPTPEPAEDDEEQP